VIKVDADFEYQRAIIARQVECLELKRTALLSTYLAEAT